VKYLLVKRVFYQYLDDCVAIFLTIVSMSNDILQIELTMVKYLCRKIYYFQNQIYKMTYDTAIKQILRILQEFKRNNCKRIAIDNEL
jgi:hypothetical protein